MSEPKTTIQVARTVKESLDSMRLYGRETYNDIIERLIEDSSELSADTKRDIQKARSEIRAGKYKTHEELGSELGF